MVRTIVTVVGLAGGQGACGGPAAGAGADGGADGSAAVTLGEVGAPGVLGLTPSCVVVAQLDTLRCVPRAGGPARVVAALPGRVFVGLAGDGDAVIATSLADSFGPSGDRVMRIDRVSLGDGAITALGTSGAGYGAGAGLAMAGADVVYSTGGSATLQAVPRTGGATRVLASDSGNFGDVATIGTKVYWINSTGIYAHDATQPEVFTDTFVGSTPSLAPALASAGATLVAAGGSPEGTTTVVAEVLPTAGQPITVPGAFAGVAVNGAGRAVVAAGADVVAVDTASGATIVLAAGEQPAAIAFDDRGLVWVTAAGAIRGLAPR